MGGSAPAVTVKFHFRGDGNFVLRTVNPEHTFDLHSGHALRKNFAIDVTGAECYLRIAITFQNIFVHFFVAGVVGGFSAGRVKNNLATNGVSCGIEMQFSAFESKRTMYRVEIALQNNAGFGLCGVAMKDALLRCCAEAKQYCDGC